MLKCKALDDNGVRVVGYFVNYIGESSVAIYAGGFHSIVCNKSTLEFI